MEATDPAFPVTVGRCIYCPSTDDLSEEHVIPAALNGVWKLKEASCKKHRDVTSAFEGRVTGRGLGAFRAKLNLHTRHKKLRPAAFPISVGTGDEIARYVVQVADHPAGFAMPVFGPPTHPSSGEVDGELRVVGRRTIWHKPSAHRIAERFDVSVLNVPLIDPLSLAQTLAKIAYAFAVGCCGLEYFEDVYVLPTILEGGRDAGRYVGNLSTSPITTRTGAHEVLLMQSGNELTAHIWLFTELNLPVYTVVIGRVRHG